MRDESQFSSIFAELQKHAQRPDTFDIRSAFAKDPARFEKFSLNLDDLLLDYSKCPISETIIDLLMRLAGASGVVARRDAMFAGAEINTTEHRAVLHVALRLPEGEQLTIAGRNIVTDVHEVLNRMAKFAVAVRGGDHTGFTGKKITDIVNVGIGGSDLGPAMVTQALTPYHDGPKTHFISNVDSAAIADCLPLLNPETTIFVIASKTFTTVETMTNARIARQWITEQLGELAVSKHFVAVSSAPDKVSDFGIDSSKIFSFWNWVGGRYSIWSAIGLPVMLAIGPDQFYQFLAGAHSMDEHFKAAPMEKNLPILLGLLGFWHRVVCGFPTRAVIPYEQRLLRLPAYLQQLDMESNGKSTSLDNLPVRYSTGPIVWGEPGTNGQHAFFQLLHQGTDIVPIEFIVSVYGHEPNLRKQHQLLIANCLAQSKALLEGRAQDIVLTSLLKAGMNEDEAHKLAPHKSCAGNRPSITIIQDKLTPFALGRLIALYEHRVFVEGVVMNINSFDQWGVELGKDLANDLLPKLMGDAETSVDDASTNGLLAFIKQRRSRQS